MTRIRLRTSAKTLHSSRTFLIRGGVLLLCLSIYPLAAHASPFDSGITSIQTLFTGTIAKAAALIAIVIGGFGFAFGEPGAKKNLAGVAMGSGIAIMATNVLTWLWGG
jgi:type IV secretory pathway VirB2 component (pilin)